MTTSVTKTALAATGGVVAAVTLNDSLGVVRYDPQQVSPAQIAAHLTRLTGFGATVLPDSSKARGSPGPE